LVGGQRKFVSEVKFFENIFWLTMRKKENIFCPLDKKISQKFGLASKKNFWQRSRSGEKFYPDESKKVVKFLWSASLGRCQGKVTHH
jgi:hypothetical protein